MKNVRIDWKDYVTKHSGLILLSVITSVLCFGFLALDGNIRIDTEELINTPGTTLGWLRIGRFGLVLFKRFLGLSTHHAWLSGLLFLLFFNLSANLLTFLFYHVSGKNEKYPYWVFLLLYSTSNIWCYQIYFSLQQAEVALALFLIALAAFLAFEGSFIARGFWGFVCQLFAGILLIVGFGAYQAFVAYYIAVCVSSFLLYLFSRHTSDVRALFSGTGKLLASFAFSYGIYLWIAKTWFMSTGEYLTGQMGWGRLTAAGCIKNIVKTVQRVVICRGSEYFSFYAIGAVFTAVAVIMICRRNFAKNRVKCVLCAASAFGLMLTPFLMTVYMGEFVVTRAQFALPVASAFLGMYGIGELTAVSGKKFAALSSLLAFVFMLVQFAYCMQLTYTDDVRYREDVLFADDVLHTISETCGENAVKKPFVFVGRRIPKLKRGCTRTEMFGWSFFEWDYHPAMQTGATHRIVGFLNAYADAGFKELRDETLLLEAEKAAKELPVYPEKKSVLETKDYILVHLSDEDEG